MSIEYEFRCWEAQFWLFSAVAAKIQDGAQNNNISRFDKTCAFFSGLRGVFIITAYYTSQSDP